MQENRFGGRCHRHMVDAGMSSVDRSAGESAVHVSAVDGVDRNPG